MIYKVGLRLSVIVHVEAGSEDEALDKLCGDEETQSPCHERAVTLESIHQSLKCWPDSNDIEWVEEEDDNPEYELLLDSR